MKYLILQHWFCYPTRQSVEESSPKLRDTCQGTQLLLQSSSVWYRRCHKKRPMLPACLLLGVPLLPQQSWVGVPAPSTELKNPAALHSSPQKAMDQLAASLWPATICSGAFLIPSMNPTSSVLLWFSRFQEAKQRVSCILNDYRTGISLVCCSIGYLGTTWWETESTKKHFKVITTLRWYQLY